MGFNRLAKSLGWVTQPALVQDGSVFVINSPQTPDIKADVMEAVKRSRSVCILQPVIALLDVSLPPPRVAMKRKRAMAVRSDCLQYVTALLGKGRAAV